MEEDEFSMKDDIEILEKLKRKLGFLAKGLVWLKKKHTEQIIFINSESFLKRVAEDMVACKTNIYTKMERKMLKDIKELKKQRLNSSSLEEDD
jgi:L-lactate utilization protein LutC